MAVIGLAHTNPQLAMHLIDSTKWRIIVYADSPVVTSRYEKALQSKDKTRRTVLFLFGALHIAKVVPRASEFDTVVVVDDVQNLGMLRNHITQFRIEDIEDQGSGLHPKYLTPAQFALAMDLPGSIPSQLPVMTVVTHALSRKRPSVLEAMGKIPTPSTTPPSNLQAAVLRIQGLLTEEDVEIGVLLSVLAKHVFKLAPASTSKGISNHLKMVEAQEAWVETLLLADRISPAMSKCFSHLCENKDPGLRLREVAKIYDALEIVDDLLYLTTIFPPSPSWLDSMHNRTK